MQKNQSTANKHLISSIQIPPSGEGNTEAAFEHNCKSQHPAASCGAPGKCSAAVEKDRHQCHANEGDSVCAYVPNHSSTHHGEYCDCIENDLDENGTSEDSELQDKHSRYPAASYGAPRGCRATDGIRNLKQTEVTGMHQSSSSTDSSNHERPNKPRAPNGSTIRGKVDWWEAWAQSHSHSNIRSSKLRAEGEPRGTKQKEVTLHSARSSNPPSCQRSRSCQ